jgi:hypothetical protein
MENKLRLLIRKTLIENYQNSNILQEAHQTVASMSAKLSPESVAKVQAQFNEIQSNINAAAKYPWQPYSSKDPNVQSQAKTKNAEYNLLVEMIHEGLPIESQKNALMLMYSQENKALKRVSGVYVSRDFGDVNGATLEDAFRDGWARIFIGTPQKLDPSKEYKKFEDYAVEYANDVKGLVTASFAGTLVNSIQTATRESYSDLVNTKMSSLDAPSTVTGKASDVEGGEDYGSDTLHTSSGGAEDTMSGFGGGFEGDDESSVNLDTDIQSDDYVDTGNDAETTLGANIEDELEDSEAQEMAAKRAKTMSKILIASLEEAIMDFKQFGKPSDTQIAGLNLLSNVLNTGQAIDPKDLRFVNDLKKNKRFMNTVNRYMYENGFRNSRNKPVSFEDIKMKYVTDAVNFLKTRDTAHVPAEKGLSTDYVSDETASEKSKEIFGDVDLKDIRNKVISLKKNLKNIVTQNPSDENLEGVQALSGIFSGLDLRQVANKLGKPVSDINDAVLSLKQGTNAQEVVDLVRALKTGKYKPGYEVPYDAEAEQSLAEAVKIADSILMEKFMKKNLDKIMERVYHRLSKNL